MKRSKSWLAVLPSLVIPVCIGMTLYLGLLALIDQQVIQDQTVLRYLTGHPVSQISVAMFLVGVASLMQIGVNVFSQFRSERWIRIDAQQLESISESVEEGQEDGSVDVPSLPSVRNLALAGGEMMIDLPRQTHDHYLWQRIVNAMHSVYRTGTAEKIEDELKHLADLDLDRQQQRYSLVQILIWATPMLGFLGTVLGISQALGGIQVGPENDFQQMMNGLRGSLYIAFDTTALALTLSMVLMFGQFLVDRFESQLLQLVDQRAHAEIAGLFGRGEESGAKPLPVDSQLLEAVRESAQKQTAIWQTSIKAAEKAWMASLSEVGGEVQLRFHAALDESVTRLAHYLGEAIEKGDHAMTHRWEQWQVLLSDNARLMATHQVQLSEQTELIQKLLVQTQDTALFDPAINKNRDAIEETSRLRETLAELSHVVSELKMSDERKSKTNGTSGPEWDESSMDTASGEGNEQIYEETVLSGRLAIPEIVLPDVETHRRIVEVDLNSISGDASESAEIILPQTKKAA